MPERLLDEVGACAGSGQSVAAVRLRHAADARRRTCFSRRLAVVALAELHPHTA
jgi:hypothetical protein